MSTQIKKLMNLYDQPGIIDLLNKFIFTKNPLNEYYDDESYTIGDLIIKISDDKTYDVYKCVKNTTGTFNVNHWHKIDLLSLINQSETSMNSIINDMIGLKSNIAITNDTNLSEMKSVIYRNATSDVTLGVKSNGFVFI